MFQDESDKILINNLLFLSQLYGQNKNFVLGGGGNSSVKTADKLFVKASGCSLAELKNEELIVLDRHLLNAMDDMDFPDLASEREKLIVQGLEDSKVYKTQSLRASVESNLHHLMPWRYVLHTHALFSNSLLCSTGFEAYKSQFFNEKVLTIPYVDPGFTLYSHVKEALNQFENKYKTMPQLIVLENYGLFVGANEAQEVHRIYQDLDYVFKKALRSYFPNLFQLEEAEGKSFVNDESNEVHHLCEALKLSGLTEYTVLQKESVYFKSYQKKAQLKKFPELSPFTPDHIVYNKRNILSLDGKISDYSSTILSEKINAYLKQYGFIPTVMADLAGNVIGIAKTKKRAELNIEVFEERLKLFYLSFAFGGPRFLNEKAMHFIENWEAENYREARVSTP